MPMAQSAQRSWFESSNKGAEASSWAENLMGAVQRTVIISEILDSRTRHLIQASHALLHYFCSVALFPACQPSGYTHVQQAPGFQVKMALRL